MLLSVFNEPNQLFLKLYFQFVHCEINFLPTWSRVCLQPVRWLTWLPLFNLGCFTFSRSRSHHLLSCCNKTVGCTKLKGHYTYIHCVLDLKQKSYLISLSVPLSNASFNHFCHLGWTAPNTCACSYSHAHKYSEGCSVIMESEILSVHCLSRGYNNGVIASLPHMPAEGVQLLGNTH